MDEIVKDGSGVMVRVHNAQHLQTFSMRHFLRIARIRHRFVFVILQPDVAQLHIRHVFHIHPTHLRTFFRFINSLINYYEL